ncbi:uncharacterized protein LOC128482706 [Spea bombifrons]|uniref:uncharacterized protein LOC128482706 n=1 Tax=Spea bombifrons TaxID=233779 RepID=UPI00234AD3AD|nr:uncharacterized protein LOC128482706 [Spea bombifrons]
MTAPEIHEDELEELLIYEDLFWEYFNDFLSLPAFPVRLTYNRLTGNVQELDDLLQEKPVGYGADDLQRERTLSWLRKERLPLFRKSPLFLEYKLAKLLLRPLEAPRSLSRYRIHGYSRQSNSTALSSLTSNPPTASHHPRAPHGPPEREATPRMPSRARSSPAATGYSSEAYSLWLLEQYGDVIGRLWGALDTEVPSLGESEMIPDGEESRGAQPPAIPCSEDTETVGYG